jgi:hypothetical protein
MNLKRLIAIVLVGALAVAGCGSSSKAGGSGSKQAEAKSAATGDIPDNQVFLTYRGTGYSLKYPEGWTRTGTPTDLTFRDKNNSIHLVVRGGAKPTAASAKAALQGKSGVHVTSAAPVSLKGRPAIKVSYREPGPADPVTGKRPLLVVDRYLYARGAKIAVLDLATQKGVDNVDAYRLISQSFRWR